MPSQPHITEELRQRLIHSMVPTKLRDMVEQLGIAPDSTRRYTSAEVTQLLTGFIGMLNSNPRWPLRATLSQARPNKMIIEIDLIAAIEAPKRCPEPTAAPPPSEG
jgi:hypothetical protein